MSIPPMDGVEYTSLFTPPSSSEHRFQDAIKNLSEDAVVDYIRSNPPQAFLRTQEAIKIRKMNVKKGGRDRSTILQKSLVVLFDGTIFRTCKMEGKRSCPEGDELGSGCSKSVVKVKDLNSGSFVAIGYSSDSSIVTKMENEGRMSNVADSPYILKTQYYARINFHKKDPLFCKTAYTKSEVCQDSFYNKLEKDSNFLRDRPYLIDQAEEAYQAMHDAGIAHNDGNLTNWLIGQDGTAKLIDFERARYLPADPELRKAFKQRDENDLYLLRLAAKLV